MDIIVLLQVLSQCLDQTSIERLQVIVLALLTMTGRVTMLGLARWTEKGGSYRTIQRFYNTVIPWGMVLWLLFSTYLYQPAAEYLLVGDESVVSKAGKKTYGLDRFFSSIFGKPVRGLAFFALSLVNVTERKAYPLLVEQVVRTAAEPVDVQHKQTKAPAKKGMSAPKKGKPGRRKGTKNKDKRQIEWNDELRHIDRMASTLLQRMGQFCTVRYFVLDGHFGNNNVMQMVRQSLSLQLVSKLRNDSALYLLYDGPQKPSGRKRIYGAKIDYDHLPSKYLLQTTRQDGIQTDIYQAPMLHKSFADPINVVIIVKTNLARKQKAHVVLFSSDLALPYDKLINYYQLRFQIEFNFRDAKQFWGLEDFMNVNPTPVTNAVGLAFFMVNFSQVLLAHFRNTVPDFSLLDLKAYFTARRYAREALKLLPDAADNIVIDQMLDAMPPLGAIHAQPARLATP